MPMKIAYDHQAFCMQSYGGISRYHVKLAEYLHRLGEDVTIFAPLHRNRYLSASNQAIVHGWGLKRYRFPSSRTMLRLNASIARKHINAWHPDIFHATYYAETPILTSASKCVITVHDMTHELFPEHVRSDDNTSELKRAAVARADHIICVSESTRTDLLTLFDIDPQNTTVVHLGMEPFINTASQVTSPAAQRDKPFILFVGRRGGYKNFNSLLQSVASSSRLKEQFDIVAFGGSSFRARERTIIQQLGFRADQVQQISGCDSVLHGLYRSAAVLVYPSLYEGFGLPPLEAMSAGCPVVSSRISSMPEVLGDAAQWFESGSTADLSKAMETVLFSSKRANKLRELGRLRSTQFSWETCARRTLSVYQQVMGQPRNRA